MLGLSFHSHKHFRASKFGDNFKTTHMSISQATQNHRNENHYISHLFGRASQRNEKAESSHSVKSHCSGPSGLNCLAKHQFGASKSKAGASSLYPPPERERERAVALAESSAAPLPASVKRRASSSAKLRSLRSRLIFYFNFDHLFY
jgi:hypothetical protein